MIPERVRTMRVAAIWFSFATVLALLPEWEVGSFLPQGKTWEVITTVVTLVAFFFWWRRGMEKAIAEEIAKARASAEPGQGLGARGVGLEEARLQALLAEPRTQKLFADAKKGHVAHGTKMTLGVPVLLVMALAASFLDPANSPLARLRQWAYMLVHSEALAIAVFLVLCSLPVVARVGSRRKTCILRPGGITILRLSHRLPLFDALLAMVAFSILCLHVSALAVVSVPWPWNAYLLCMTTLMAGAIAYYRRHRQVESGRFDIILDDRSVVVPTMGAIIPEFGANFKIRRSRIVGVATREERVADSDSSDIKPVYVTCLLYDENLAKEVEAFSSESAAASFTGWLARHLNTRVLPAPAQGQESVPESRQE